MFTSLIAFLGGSAFRMIWGELSSHFSKSQEHSMEIERIKLQGELDASQHARNLEAITVQAGLGVKTIQVQAEAEVLSIRAQSESLVSQVEANGWFEAVKDTGKSIGIAWVDAWNSAIRPGVATWSIIMMTLGEFGVIALSDNTLAISGAALGIYLADRTLAKRGK
jgi:hypothetical protein